MDRILGKLDNEDDLENILAEETNTDEDELRDSIIKSEFEVALNEMKNKKNKAPRIGRIEAYILKLGEEEATDKLFKLISYIIIIM